MLPAHGRWLPWTTTTSPSASTATRSRAGSSPKPTASPTPPQLVAAAGEQLVLSGIPLYRLAYFQLTLHPEFPGKAYFWRRGRGVETGTRPHGDNQDAEYRDNPLPAGPRAAQDGARAPRPDRAAGTAAAPTQGRRRDRLRGAAAALHHRPCRCAERRVRQAGRLLGQRSRPHVPAAVRLHAPRRDPFPARHRSPTCSTPMSAAPPASASWQAR